MTHDPRPTTHDQEYDQHLEYLEVEIFYVMAEKHSIHKTCTACGKGLYKRYLIENPLGPAEGLSGALAAKTPKIKEHCKVCGKWVVNLVRHIRQIHINKDTVTCEVCNAVLMKGSLASHMARKHSKTNNVKCDHCGGMFKNVMSLREHMNNVYRKTNPYVKPKSLLMCSACGIYDFESQQEYDQHLEYCKRCTSCSKVFNTREDYTNHVNTCPRSLVITGVDLHATSEEVVGEMGILASHDDDGVENIFAIMDPFCEACGEIFVDQESLAKHVLETHPDMLLQEGCDVISEAVLHACPVENCGFLAASKAALETHSKLHNGKG